MFCALINHGMGSASAVNYHSYYTPVQPLGQNIAWTLQKILAGLTTISAAAIINKWSKFCFVPNALA
jgi:hypothetical protein